MKTLERFRCVPLACTLSAEGCARKHRRASEGARKGAYGSLTLDASPTCRTCEVGAAHARGERPQAWPDGSPIIRSEIDLDAAQGPCPSPVPRRPQDEAKGTDSRPLRSGEPLTTSKSGPSAALTSTRVGEAEGGLGEPGADPGAQAPTSHGGEGRSAGSRDAHEGEDGAARAPTTERKGDSMARPATRYITHEGETLTLEAWASRIGISGSALRQRLRAGWSAEQALSTGRTDGPGGKRPPRSKPVQASAARPAPAAQTDRRIEEAIEALRERRAGLWIEITRLDEVLRTLEGLTGAAA